MAFYMWVLIKFIVGFLIIITHMNISGKTQLAQMTPVDFIGNFVLGAALGGVVYSETIPFHQYVIVLLMGVIFISSLNHLTKHFSAARKVAIGDPIPIIKDGKFLTSNIMSKSNKIDILNINTQMHSQGILSFQSVKYAQIEPNGMLTAICDANKVPAVILMNNDDIRDSVLKDIGKEEEWLLSEIEKRALRQEDIFLIEYWKDKLFFVMKNGATMS